MPGAEPRRPFGARPPTQGSARPLPQADPPPAAHPGAPRAGRPDEVPLADLAPDRFARLTLALLRHHFQTFAAPESHGWLSALRTAAAQVGPDAAGGLCHDVVVLVQALRGARRAPFHFNPEGCACCRDWLTAEERQLMELLEALRRGQTGRARMLVQLLCDGVPDDDLLLAAAAFLRRHAPGAGAAARAAPAG